MRIKKIINSILNGGILAVIISNWIIIENILRLINNKNKINNLSKFDIIHIRISLILVYFFINGIKKISLFFIYLYNNRRDINNNNKLFWFWNSIGFLCFSLNLLIEIDIYKHDTISDYFLKILFAFVTIGNIAFFIFLIFILFLICFIYISFPNSRQNIIEMNLINRFDYINSDNFFFFTEIIHVNPNMNVGLNEDELDLISEFEVKDNKKYELLDIYNSNNCIICIDNFENNDIILRLPHCKHVFHKLCVRDWLRLKDECPLCKNKVSIFL